VNYLKKEAELIKPFKISNSKSKKFDEYVKAVNRFDDSEIACPDSNKD